MSIRILYLGNELARKGWSPSTIDTLAPLFRRDHQVRTYSSLVNQGIRFLHMVWGILVNSRWADMILVDTYSGRALWYARMATRMGRAFRIPVVLFLHGGELPSRIRKQRGQMMRLGNRATALVAPSGYLKEAFEDMGRPVHLIPNYLDLDRYSFIERSFIRPNLLWVRAIQKLYNPEMAIEVVESIRRNHPDATLCMVGGDKDGSMERIRTQVIDKDLEERVEITGRLPKEEWIRRSVKYDIFLNTTNADNTPVSVMEAMALGMVVISTNVGGVPYLIEDGVDGLLVPPRDPEAMTQAIEKVLQDPQWATTLSRNARVKAESWDWEKVKVKWESLFSKLIESD
ncbi:MAG: glycosyltransferase family 4 protein [Bacteroidota bacterium]|nr:glycosyltransferase family 4 protein [Bacteroidota bacterium]